MLVDAARQLDPVRPQTVVRHLRHVADPDGAERDAVAALERRGLYASPTSDGMVRVDGRLDPDTGEALLTPVNSGPPPGEDDRRTPASAVGRPDH